MKSDTRSANLVCRPRRVRGNDHIRRMVRETRMNPASLVMPVFLKEGKNIKSEISSLENHFYLSPDRVCEEIEVALNQGVSNFLLFGIPNLKDEKGSEAYGEKGIVQEGIRAVKREFGSDVHIITDVCMCEYTSHGHCGILKDGDVDNDTTLSYLQKTAVSHARAGADTVAPSDMMDGRVGSIREALDKNGYTQIPILSYAVKYASSFYGPFREAAGSTPSFGDRKTYQMDPHNSREAVKEALLDANEGADILMIKPALSYLDVIKTVKENTNLPVAAYSVSGEYAMIKAASRAGLVDETGVMCESAVSIYRAGADILISYYAKELSRAMQNGVIG